MMLRRPLTRRSMLRETLRASSGALAGCAAAAIVSGVHAQSPPKASAITITNVETFPLRHQMRRPMGVSTALSDVRQCMLVKISTDSGLYGWGETTDVGGTRGGIEAHLKPKLLGKNPLEHRQLWRSL